MQGRTIIHTLAAILLAFLPLRAEAHNTAREFAEMKLNKDYLCEESTTQDPKQALENADLLLINRVNEYLAQNHPGTPLSPAVLAGIKHLTMLRGDHTRVLSYISVAEVTGGAPPAAPAPAPNAQPAPAAPEPTPAPAPTPAATKQEPAPAPTQPSQSSQSSHPSHNSHNSQPPSLPQWQLEVIQELLKAKDIAEASSLLGFFQQIKKVKSFGIVTDCPDRDTVYWIVGNPAGGIKAALSPASPDGSRHNFSDGSSATLASFSGNPAIWFAF